VILEKDQLAYGTKGKGVDITLHCSEWRAIQSQHPLQRLGGFSAGSNALHVKQDAVGAALSENKHLGSNVSNHHPPADEGRLSGQSGLLKQPMQFGHAIGPGGYKLRIFQLLGAGSAQQQ
jgi:hypothetical protein